MSAWVAHRRVLRAAHSIAGMFVLARAEAMRTGHAHVVLLDRNAPSPMVLVDLGAPGAERGGCRTDAVEATRALDRVAGVDWGRAIAPAWETAPNDRFQRIPASGLAFPVREGGPAAAVMFQPGGAPVALDAACNAGPTGSGGGSIYLTNQRQDYAVILSPEGNVRVHSFDPASGTWTQ